VSGAQQDGAAPPDADVSREGGASSPLLQGVAFHALESRADGVLWDVQPLFVIMVVSDVAFVRQLEVCMHHLPSCRASLSMA
jgi:hypothetical protein